MHCSKLIVSIGGHDAVLKHRLARVVVGVNMLQDSSHDRKGFAWFGDLPTHSHDQEEADQQEKKRSNTVLDSDHLVVGGEDVLGHEMLVAVIMTLMGIVMIFV